MLTQNQKLIPGQSIAIGGDTYMVPPLSLGQLRRLRERIDRISRIKLGGNSLSDLPDDLFADVIEIMREALSRNYADVTTEQMEDLIDVGNMQRVLAAVMGLSGFTDKPGDASGEVVAASPVSTGMPSTPSSSAAPAGPGNTSTTA